MSLNYGPYKPAGSTKTNTLTNYYQKMDLSNPNPTTPRRKQTVWRCDFCEIWGGDLRRLVEEMLPAARVLAGDGGGDATELLASVDDVLEYMEAYSRSMPGAVPSLRRKLDEIAESNGELLRVSRDGRVPPQPYHESLSKKLGGGAVLERAVAMPEVATDHPDSRSDGFVQLPEADMAFECRRGRRGRRHVAKKGHCHREGHRRGVHGTRAGRGGCRSRRPRPEAGGGRYGTAPGPRACRGRRGRPVGQRRVLRMDQRQRQGAAAVPRT